MPSLPVIEQDQVRHAGNAPDGGAFDAPVLDAHEAARAAYCERLGDDALVLGQRLSEWCGHAPALEVDLSLANFALDLIGQATHFLGEAGGEGRRAPGTAEEARGASSPSPADRLAFHRDVLDYKNCLLVEQPNGDFARTMARQWLFSTWQHLLYREMCSSADTAIAGIAAKGVKEVAYHRELAQDWVVRLGDGTDESKRRMAEGLDWCWRFVPELFEVDELLRGLIARGVAADPRSFQVEYRAAIEAGLAEAGLAVPTDTRPILGGRRGHHSEHLGHLLAVMQHIPRTYPDATW